ncbi:MAG: hypothetical protein ACE1Z2_09055 [Acidobacteriota bacterium]
MLLVVDAFDIARGRKQ